MNKRCKIYSKGIKNEEELTMSIFSERLKTARNNKGWTRKRAVSELGIPYPTYSGYEQGNRQPDIETMKKIATAYDTTIDYLTGKTDNPSPMSDEIKQVDLKNDPVVLSYGGKPISKEDMDIIKAILRRHKDE